MKAYNTKFRRRDYEIDVEYTLNRNFMGYTDQKTKVTIGLGVSAISDSFFGMSQNVKNLDAYYDFLKKDLIPVLRGHILTTEDVLVRNSIHDLMCKLKTTVGKHFPQKEHIYDRLAQAHSDGLITINDDVIEITPRGKTFLRNICLAFDLKLWAKEPKDQLFSMAV